MSIFQGIVLGVLQGIAEFLPISSSGHLIVAQNLFGLEEVPLLFDVFLHVATLLAVVLYFRKKIWELICSFARIFVPVKNPSAVQIEKKDEDTKYIVAIILATFVTGVLGIFSSKVISEISVKLVCAGFVVTALLLIFSSLIEKKHLSYSETSLKSPSWKQSLVIGLAQGIGTLPGISRSGSTIAGSLFCGVKRDVAGEFSFIVSIPAILGAFILELKDLGEVSSSIGAEPVIAGCAAAFASGYIALSWLMKLIKKGRLEWFACYLIPVGILGMIFLH
ncbi:undecaprenyl-diphosphate phosphatase [uncultured Treponema sp.]|uniref:undecaprenyl-diphosphate phosphatase n=1 Tax=uncultured Treponema sp. TaxID=162155 RepID=UPI000E9F6CA9|nr:undecaprenyl-diphosphate phosphatase [uncultured Treponema sp.]HAZ96419.1 undecaprenyl-diphosphatase [Treponema sp.]